MGRVVECHGANNIWLRRWRKNTIAQQFFFDAVSKTIRSQQWKNYGLEIQSNGGSTNLRMTSAANSRWWNLFRWQAPYVVNEKGKVMDVAGGIDAEQRNIQIWTKNTGLGQQWDVIYADEYPREPVKGELNTDFGLFVDRDFYVVSAMKSHRYIDLIMSGRH